VGELADRSKQATAQVKTILSDIQKSTNTTVVATEEGIKGVEKGVRLTAQAQKAIEQLASVIEESAQLATQVVSSGQQQQVSIEQIAQAMQSIDQTTRQSLDGIRQIESAAQDLNDLAGELDEMVMEYQL
jgi:methyl-accepting chemotaxis protein